MSNQTSDNRSPITNPSALELRTARRHRWDRDACCQVARAEREPRWSARVRDISTGGVALFLLRQIPVGAALSVTLRDAQGRGLRTLPARVVHTRVHSSGRWILGCEFENPISDVELETWLRDK
jgi:hypothetical protein